MEYFRLVESLAWGCVGLVRCLKIFSGYLNLPQMHISSTARPHLSIIGTLGYIVFDFKCLEGELIKVGDVLACWTLNKVFEFKLWPGSLCSWQEVSVGFPKLLGQSDTIPGEEACDGPPSLPGGEAILLHRWTLQLVWVGLDFNCPFEGVYPWWRTLKRIFDDLTRSLKTYMYSRSLKIRIFQGSFKGLMLKTSASQTHYGS